MSDEVLPLLQRAGIEPVEDPRASRKLILPTRQEDVRIVVIRGSDVPTYVAHGAADVGVTGKDTLLEHPNGDYYEPLDLGLAPCRLMTAGPVGGAPHRQGRRRVATKFVNIARRFYAERGEQVDLIPLGGAMELAPLIGLADEIVDIVDTGRTLAANGLEPWEKIADISSRLIVNKASMKRHAELIGGLIERLREAVAAGSGAATS